jgi:hypothetical protein
MKVTQIMEILNARLVTGEDLLDPEIRTACGSDMMSDVLASSQNKDILLTGLVNPQVVRTADMLDVRCLVFVRGKKPDEALIALAKERGIIVLCTELRMFEACGRLYAGLLGEGSDKHGSADE